MRPRLALGLVLVAAALVGGPPDASAQDAAADARPTWGTSLSDVIVFDRARWSISTLPAAGADAAADGVELKDPEPFTISGSDIRARQYAPADPRRADLPALLAYRLPSADAAAGDPVELEWTLRQTAPLHVEGTLDVLPAEAPGHVIVRGSWTLTTKRRPDKADKHRIRDGVATTELTFDVTRGIPTHARIEMEYDLENLDAKRGVAPQRVTTRFDWALTGHRPARYEGYRGDVAAAIDRGVAWLRENRTTDEADLAKGLWKPHGGYRVGTTALSLLTLVACEVPREDPLVQAALEWIFARKPPSKTYERAVALMAIDEAYAPPGERARLAAGGSPTPRELPAERLAWCMQVAAELEKTNTSPGSWGYPPAGRVIPNLDTSNTQYAILGLHAATHLGYEPEESTWLGVLRHFEMVRQKDPERGAVALVRAGDAIPDEAATTQGAIPVKEAAGFRYTTMKGPNEVWASMTCAAIASLSVARHQLRRIGSRKLSKSVDREIEDAIVGAWAWLDANWATDRHPQHPGNDWYTYYLYSLERAAILHGVKRVGGRDWYFEGAAQLLARQENDGGWAKGKESAVAETCLALLFLKRATAPLTGK